MIDSYLEQQSTVISVIFDSVDNNSKDFYEFYRYGLVPGKGPSRSI